jgi:hypothetical protein
VAWKAGAPAPTAYCAAMQERRWLKGQAPQGKLANWAGMGPLARGRRATGLGPPLPVPASLAAPRTTQPRPAPPHPTPPHPTPPHRTPF